MQFEPNNIYHVYNRGNDKQQIFFVDNNYHYFLDKVKRHISPHCDILAWCLMPNHFHFLLYANEKSCIPASQKPFPVFQLVNGFRLMLSSYSKAINIQQGKTGNLFQQKTRSKCVSSGGEFYGITAFRYIHKNPLAAGLVKRMEDWQFSSFKDYAGLRKATVCNKELTLKLLDFNMNTFYKDSYEDIDERVISNIFC